MELKQAIDGRVTAVRRAVLDVAFDGTTLPPINEALVITPDEGGPIIAEVQSHLDEATVRALALQSTAGLRRGVAAHATGGALQVPIGDRGQHALVVVDDLTKHAATRREVALLTREPCGREAYPGDIFYLHSRLLERSVKLSAELGGGSLTTLPIAETDAGNLSAYIPTNLISITDGQCQPGRRQGQTAAVRAVSGRVRLDYTQFLELEMFTRPGGLSDTRVKAQITRGERIRIP